MEFDLTGKLIDSHDQASVSPKTMNMLYVQRVLETWNSNYIECSL